MKNRLQKSIIFNILILSLISCGNINNKNKQKINGSGLEVKNNQFESKLDTLTLFSIEPKADYLYIVNSKCSFCLGQFFAFSDDIINKEPDSKIIALVEVGYMDIVEYYLSNDFKEKQKNITILENESIFLDDLVKNNGLYYDLNNNKSYNYILLN